MNEELVEKRLSDIEGKIDKIMDIVSQTQLQEYRLKVVENDVTVLKTAVNKLEKSKGDTAVKWLGIIGAGIVTILLSYIAVKVGLK